MTVFMSKNNLVDREPHTTIREGPISIIGLTESMVNPYEVKKRNEISTRPLPSYADVIRSLKRKSNIELKDMMFEIRKEVLEREEAE